MKQFFTFLATCVFALQLSAQVTYNFEDFPIQNSFIDTFLLGSADLPVPDPMGGADQTWDYGTIDVQAELILTIQSDASDNLDFPEAIYARPTNKILQNFSIPIDEINAANETAFYEAGLIQYEVAYDIQAITGSPGDTLRFVDATIIYDNGYDALQFPAQYQSQWTNTKTENSPFELTVAAFGLQDTPGNQKTIFTHTREVIGYGDLIIPDKQGNPSNPLPALLIKVNDTFIDSTFLGGQPAPPPLMAAFGLEQGQTFDREFYRWYVPGFGLPVANVGVTDRFSYRPAAASLSTSTAEAFTLQGKCFPNPVAAGEFLTFQLEKPFNAGTFRLTDLAGKAVYTTQITTGGQTNFTVDIPAETNQGMYFYQLENEDGELMRPKLIYVK